MAIPAHAVYFKDLNLDDEVMMKGEVYRVIEKSQKRDAGELMTTVTLLPLPLNITRTADSSAIAFVVN